MEEMSIGRCRAIAESMGLEESVILGGISTAYYFGEEYEQAEDYACRALELNPEDPHRMYGLARVLIRAGIDLGKGMELIEKAIELNPDYYGYYYVQGLGLHQQGRHEEALKALNKAWEIRGLYDLDLLREIQAVEKALEEQESSP